MPVSTFTWIGTGGPPWRMTLRSMRTRSALWMVMPICPRMTSCSSPETTAPRTTIGAVTPALRSSSASVESPTPRQATPSFARCHATGTAPCPYASAFRTSIRSTPAPA